MIIKLVDRLVDRLKVGVRWEEVELGLLVVVIFFLEGGPLTEEVLIKKELGDRFKADDSATTDEFFLSINVKKNTLTFLKQNIPIVTV